MTSKVVMVNDVSRAFFEVPSVRQVCVELPDEDKTHADKVAENVDHLQTGLYGTRDAAMNCQEEVAREMKKWSFQRGRYNPCMYWKSSDDFLAMVHGDDLVSVASREATSLFRKQLEGRFDIKTQDIGSGDGRNLGTGKAGIAAPSARTVAVDKPEPEEVTEGWVHQVDE